MHTYLLSLNHDFGERLVTVGLFNVVIMFFMSLGLQLGIDQSPCVCVSDERLTGSSQLESTALAQFNKSWAELADWLTMLDNMVQNKCVVVADLDDIDDNIGKLKVK